MHKAIKQAYVVPVVSVQNGIAKTTLGFPSLSGEPSAGFEIGG